VKRGADAPFSHPSPRDVAITKARKGGTFASSISPAAATRMGIAGIQPPMKIVEKK
jgi:hypothetical protein